MELNIGTRSRSKGKRKGRRGRRSERKTNKPTIQKPIFPSFDKYSTVVPSNIVNVSEDETIVNLTRTDKVERVRDSDISLDFDNSTEYLIHGELEEDEYDSFLAEFEEELHINELNERDDQWYQGIDTNEFYDMWEKDMMLDDPFYQEYDTGHGMGLTEFMHHEYKMGSDESNIHEYDTVLEGGYTIEQIKAGEYPLASEYKSGEWTPPHQ